MLVENSNQLLFRQNYHQNASRSVDVSEGLLHLGLTKFTDLTIFCSFLVSHLTEVTVCGCMARTYLCQYLVRQRSHPTVPQTAKHHMRFLKEVLRTTLWPAANKESQWCRSDEDVSASFEAPKVTKGDVDMWLQTMTPS